VTDDVSILERYSRLTYRLPLVFSNITIETSNFCNRGCGFCPVGHDRKPLVRMERALFDKILGELSDLNYCGDICMQWYSDPLADMRLVDWTRLARETCPESFIYFSSNGDFLDTIRFRMLVDAGMNLVNVSQYGGRVEPNVQATQEFVDRHPEYRDALRVGIKGADVLVNARAGSIPGFAPDQPLRERCIRPDEQIIVDASGDVPLCCNDYHGAYKIGSVRESTLLELWFHPRMYEARKALREGDRTKIAICRSCNEPNALYADALPRGNPNCGA